MLENTNIEITHLSTEFIGQLYLARLQKDAMLAQQAMSHQNTTRSTGKARMRSIPQALKAIKSLDPETAVTEHYIRKLCKNGTIKTLPDGKKQLLNLDELLEYVGMGA